MNSLHSSVDNFFSRSENVKKLKEIIDDRSTQPRLIDFYVTQYAKNIPQFYLMINNDKVEGLYDVYSSYKLQLKAFHKKGFNLFDKKRDFIVGVDDNFIELPLAQMNVYRWLIENDIINLIRKSN